MSCRICGRSACTESFHRIEDQEKARVYDEDTNAMEQRIAELEAQLAEAQTRAIVWAVEWTLKITTKREDWPVSWEDGFPGLKTQALAEYALKRKLG